VSSIIIKTLITAVVAAGVLGMGALPMPTSAGPVAARPVPASGPGGRIVVTPVKPLLPASLAVGPWT
jgi:hypothetical protein